MKLESDGKKGQSENRIRNCFFNKDGEWLSEMVWEKKKKINSMLLKAQWYLDHYLVHKQISEAFLQIL